MTRPAIVVAPRTIRASRAILTASQTILAASRAILAASHAILAASWANRARTLAFLATPRPVIEAPWTVSAARWMIPAALVVLSLLGGCAGEGGRSPGTAGERVKLRFWAMGREGEVVTELVRDFEREHPTIQVDVQQIPWSAAHEKLLTAIVGGSTPDVSQLGNTWISEFVALEALRPLDPLLERTPGLSDTSYFSGVWDTNVIEGELYGLPWYVDTRLLFYRTDILAQTGRDRLPGTWEEWRAALRDIKTLGGESKYAIFLPTNEPTEAVIFGLQAGSPLLRDHDTAGAFSAPEFRRGYDFFHGLFREGLAPPVRNTQIANVYQELARGTFAMYITGPWNIGEFRRRLPAELQDDWATAPLPGPEGPATGVSLAGGSSLVIFHRSPHPQEAWKLIEYLSRPEVQVRFFALTGDLPARREAWSDSSVIADPAILAFREQLARTVATPKIPEWELIFKRVQDWSEAAIHGAMSPDSALAGLDREVDRLLEKRRWLRSRQASAENGTATTRESLP